MDDVSEIDINENEKSLSFNEFYDISSNLFKEMVDFYVDSQTVSNSEVSEIEKCTRGQASSQHWWDHRKERLTASKFYTAAVNTVESSKRINSILYSRLNLSSTRHGIQYENEALKNILEILSKNVSFSMLTTHGL